MIKYKHYKKLSKSKQEEWLFNRLNESTQGATTVLVMVSSLLLFIVSMLMNFLIATYIVASSGEQYQHLLKNIALFLSPLRYFTYGLMIISVYYIFHIGTICWKDYKLTKGVKK